MRNKNIIILFITQAFGSSASAMLFMLAAVVSKGMISNPKMITLPISAMILGTMLSSMPAAWVMRKWGRKRAFISASLLGVCAAFMAVISIYLHNFILFTLAAFLMGVNNIFVQQYRYAVIDHAPSDQAAKLVSFILFANGFSAFLGTYLAVSAKNILPYGPYSGSFTLLAFFFLINMGLFTYFNEPPKQLIAQKLISFKSLWLQTNFILPAVISAVSYAVMIALMTAMPVSMSHEYHYKMRDAAFVMQCHYLAMYLPSLVTGKLVEKFGLYEVLLIGILFLICATLTSLINKEFYGFLLSLITLGIGWNLMYLSGTLLLSKNFPGPERFSAQSLNELIVFLTNVIFAFSSGYLVELYGWQKLNLIMMTVMIALLLIVGYILYPILLWNKSSASKLDRQLP